MTAPSPSGAPASRSRSEAAVRVAWLAATVIVALVGIALDITYLTASPQVCATCHEMESAVSTWKTSAHARVGCPSCHEAALPWYRFPETLGIRATMLERDLKAHRALGADSSATTVAALPIAEETCTRCHDLSRAVTVPPGTVIDHPKHVKRNKSCTSCHFWTAHPDPAAERPLLLMGRCFTCHGRSTAAKAPGKCNVCHTKEFKERPESHAPEAAWLARHGKIAKADRQQCAMCHDPGFCTDCHGLEMPHPAGWAKGKPGHAEFGRKNRQVCAQCHTEKPDLCSMCHHKSYAPAPGPWLAQHPTMVDKRGAAFCMHCHVAVFCFNCHTTGHIISTPSTQ
jgi:nitrate/TMAO reductase-like tetraheme cytochrome c subunit